jgi:hypothetical protein
MKSLFEVTVIPRDIMQICVSYLAIPLQAWTDPEGSRSLRFPEFLDNEGGKFFSPPGHIPGTDLC